MVAGLVGRKADAFAALLEGKAPAIPDPKLAQLADIASRLSSVPQHTFVPQPTAGFRAALRDQLTATAAQSATTAAPPAAATRVPTAQTPTVPAPRVSPASAGRGLRPGGTPAGPAAPARVGGSFGRNAPVWVKLFAGVAALTVSATGVAVGADRALPGDFFYGVKKQVEAVQLDLASGPHDKAITEFGFAQARINELNTLIKREDVRAGQPVSKQTAAHIRGLLENWAENTGVATTSLIQQIQALGSNTATAAKSAQLRNQLSSFTSGQFEAVGKLLGDMPTSSLQSLTVSALGYLQRVDAVLGHNPASLIGKLPVSLNSVPGVSEVLPRLVLPSNIPTTGGKAMLPDPSAVKSVIPGAGGLLRSLAPGLLPTAVPGISLPTTGTGITLPTAGPGNLPSLVPTLGSILPPLPGVLGQLPRFNYPSTGGSSGADRGANRASPNPIPDAAQSVAAGLKSAGAAISSRVPEAIQSVAGALKSAGGAISSQVPGAVQSLAADAGKSASGAVQGVTGTLGAITGGLTSSAGPSLPLPVSLPVLPVLPKLH